jgi:hypothetical protein
VNDPFDELQRDLDRLERGEHDGRRLPYMASALAVAGRAGATAIGTTPAHADALFGAVHHALDQESRC